MFSAAEINEFNRNGFIVVRGLARRYHTAIRQVAEAHLAKHVGPIEYEAQVKYPGAPASLEDEGGRTTRRLLQAYSRDPVIQAWASSSEVVGRLQQLLGGQVALSQSHHNCIMTKHPNFSSLTNWHQDIRYWSYQRPDLISVWTALGREFPENGCLSFLPGSHTGQFAPHQFDEAKFLRSELPENASLLAQRVTPDLDPGDVMFFHCRTFHAANRNESEATKLSLVFTYRDILNEPLAGTRSTLYPDVILPDLATVST